MNDALCTLTNVIQPRQCRQVPSGNSAVRERHARAIAEAIANRRFGGLLPPVMYYNHEDVAEHVRDLCGRSDAACVEAALCRPEFRPFVALVAQTQRWCARISERYRDRVESGVLTLDNVDLFAPLIGDAFIACAGAGAQVDRRLARRLSSERCRFQAFVELFLRRLERDARAGVFAGDGFDGQVVAIWANPDETHNGRQRVLRVQWQGGATLAYKPRPADGERLFLAEGNGGDPASLFELINRLPPASGAVRLPTLRIHSGKGRDRAAYLWQEWIGPPSQWSIVRRSRHLRLRATRLTPVDAARFWHRAGALTAVCFAFGIVDLGPGNLLLGRRQGDPETMAYPVDLEVFFFPIQRLDETGLIRSRREPARIEGLEREARWQSEGGAVAAFFESDDGSLQLRRLDRPTLRTEARSLVTDMHGRAGFGAYAGDFLRGMFDLWTLVNAHSADIREFLHRGAARHFTRVLVRPTSEYVRTLDAMLLDVGHDPAADRDDYSPSERSQLRRADAPYFFRRADGIGALRCLRPPPAEFATSGAGRQPRARSEMSPDRTIREGGGHAFITLGVAVRDALDFVAEDLPHRRFSDAGSGVSLRLRGARSGEVAFDWREAGHRLTYAWDGDGMTLRARALPAASAARDRQVAAEIRVIRRDLLRIDRVDAALRARWVESGFADRVTERELRKLIAHSVVWLDEAMQRHGWPDHRRHGRAAVEAACRLVQHAEGHAAFQRRCLRLLKASAARGGASLRQVAFVTDALRVQSGRRQLYGTKFENVEGRLVPCPIERAAQVDARRKAMRLEPLSRYASRLRRHFGAVLVSGQAQ